MMFLWQSRYIYPNVSTPKPLLHLMKTATVAVAEVHDTEFASTSYVNYSSMAVYIIFTASQLRIGVRV